jgi:hypothetical protein
MPFEEKRKNFSRFAFAFAFAFLPLLLPLPLLLLLLVFAVILSGAKDPEETNLATTLQTFQPTPLPPLLLRLPFR